MLVPAGPGSFAGHWAQLPRPRGQRKKKNLWLRYTEHGSGVSLTGPVRPWREPRHKSFLVPLCFQAFKKWYRCLVAKSPEKNQT